MIIQKTMDFTVRCEVDDEIPNEKATEYFAAIEDKSSKALDAAIFECNDAFSGIGHVSSGTMTITPHCDCQRDKDNSTLGEWYTALCAIHKRMFGHLESLLLSSDPEDHRGGYDDGEDPIEHLGSQLSDL